jgi:hypothetical protein
MSIENFPSAFVTTPLDVPLIVILAPDKFEPFSLATTCPVNFRA